MPVHFSFKIKKYMLIQFWLLRVVAFEAGLSDYIYFNTQSLIQIKASNI